jgi:hypothetical protein
LCPALHHVKLAPRFLSKEEKMDKQMKLFETSKNIWVQSVWKSVGLRARPEVIKVLAQMGKALLEAEKAIKETPGKGKSDES